MENKLGKGQKRRHAKLFQSCLTLYDPMVCSPPAFYVHGILQARILEWVAISSSRRSSQPRDQTCISYIFLQWQAGSLPLALPGRQISAAKLLSHFSHAWLCATPVNGSPPGSPVLGILQARTLEWVAIAFSNAWKWKVKVKSLSHVWLLATPWTAAYQDPPSMGFSRQESWSGVPLPSLR